MNPLRATLTVASVAVALVTVSACGSSGTTAPPAAAPVSSTASADASTSPAPSTSPAAAASGSLDAANQTSDGKSVVVATVTLDAAGKGGWIALHADAGGKPGPVKYYAAVPAGPSTKVVIPTPGGITTGDYWPMLHVDDHTIGTYEFPKVTGADLPAMSGGMVVMKKITVTVK
ncbi:hypothetical protein V3N99_00040 [Dermatophilaceae bacterium Soc4.6]